MVEHDSHLSEAVLCMDGKPVINTICYILCIHPDEFLNRYIVKKPSLETLVALAGVLVLANAHGLLTCLRL